MAAERDLISSDVEAYLRGYQDKSLLRFVAVGSVDDGKSTLIGRLLVDTGSVYEDQLAAARKATQMAGADIDLSLLTDGLAAEREQGITIDVAYRYFTTAKRKFILADTPGHVQYTRNMVTGASTANVAVILIDARLGVQQQSRRHAYIAALLGIPFLAVCVNKMDLVAFDRATFERVRADFGAFTKELPFEGVTFLPISALRGDNCVHRSNRMPWYDGPTVLGLLETVPLKSDRDLERLRFPVQYVLRPNLDYRGLAGRIASGVVKSGDSVVALPSGRPTRIKSIDTYEGPIAAAFAPMSVTLRLEDDVDVSRGDMLVHAHDPPRVVRTFDAHLVWMHESPLDLGKSYLLKHTTQTVRADVDRVHCHKDMDTLAEAPASTLTLNEIGRVTVTAHRALFVDAYATDRETGSFILIDPLTNDTVGAAMIIHESSPRREGVLPDGHTEDATASSLVTARERRERYGVVAGVVLVTAGDAMEARAIARAIERRLFARNAAAAVVGGGPPAIAFAAARAVADAGLLAILPATSADEEGAQAQTEGHRLTIARAAGGSAGDSADAIVASLADSGWLR